VSRSDDACPAEDDLAAFAAGRLPLPTLDTVAAHVESCPACQATVEGLEGRVDPVEAALRRGEPEATVPPARAGISSWPETQWPTRPAAPGDAPPPPLVRPGPRLESEVRDLLRRRLFVASALAAFVLAAVLAQRLLSEAGRSTGVG
jgi:anti-sigma factor RsiW